MSKTITITLVLRHIKAQKISKSKKTSTKSKRKSVDTNKKQKVKVTKKIKVKREAVGTDLQSNYLDKITKVYPHDLAIINQPDFFPDNRKKDRHYNRAVDRALDDLKLLHFFLENLSQTYRKKILQSDQITSLVEKYLGITEYTSVNLTKEERMERLARANQLLIYSLTIFKRTLPKEFNESLKQIGKPYFTLLKSISDYTNKKIYIPDSLI